MQLYVGNSFRTRLEIANVFGKNYENFTYWHFYQDDIRTVHICCPVLSQNYDDNASQYINEIEEDWSYFYESSRTRNNTFVKDALKNRKNEYLCLFPKFKNPDGSEIYRFTGLYSLDVQTTREINKVAWKQIARYYTINEQITYPGTVEDAALDHAFHVSDEVTSIVCADGRLNFNNRFFVKEYETKLTIQQWLEKFGNSWLNYRIEKVICLDGEINHGKPIKNMDFPFKIERGVLTSVDSSALLESPNHHLEYLLIIPEGVTKIAATLTFEHPLSIILPNSLHFIKRGAFTGIRYIRHIEIQKQIHKIPDGAIGEGLKNTWNGPVLYGNYYYLARFNGPTEEYQRIANEELLWLPDVYTWDGFHGQHL